MSGQKPASDGRRRASFRVRICALSLATLAMLAAIALLAHHTWAQSAVTRGQVRQVHRVGVWLGHQIREAVHALDTRMLRFKLGADPDEWRQFKDELLTLRRWLEEQQSYLNSPEELALMTKLDAELRGYDEAAHLFAEPTQSLPENVEVAIQVTELSHRSKSLIELGFELSSAHQATADKLLAESGRDQARAQQSTLAALGLILVIGCGMGWVVYRESIAPLRRSLLESRLQLERKEKLASLGEMSATIAHEIRNPLTALKARLYSLQKQIPHDDRAAEDARMIAAEIERLERIVRDVLRFARPPQPAAVPVEPHDLARRVYELVQPQWSTGGVRFTLAAETTPAVRADPDLMLQALLNLVQNAAQAIAAAGTRGHILLRTRLAPIAGDGVRRSGVSFEVTDDGPGIPPELQHRIFDPFFTTKASGTGLGLALTARIAEAHGGRVDFESHPSRGTTFAILLPFDSP